MRESIEEAVAEAARAGAPAGQVRALLASLAVEPVFTAHPTEARRRTVLEKLRRLSQLTGALGEERLAPRARARLLDAMREEITALWLTDEVHRLAPSVFDEVRNGLYYFEQSLWDVVPRLYRAAEDALAASYPGETFAVPPFLRFGSWIGGDRDGNPHVTARVTEQTLLLHKDVALGLFERDLDELQRHLSVSSDRSSAPLAASLRGGRGGDARCRPLGGRSVRGRALPPQARVHAHAAARGAAPAPRANGAGAVGGVGGRSGRGRARARPPPVGPLHRGPAAGRPPRRVSHRRRAAGGPHPDGGQPPRGGRLAARRRPAPRRAAPGRGVRVPPRPPRPAPAQPGPRGGGGGDPARGRRGRGLPRPRRGRPGRGAGPRADEPAAAGACARGVLPGDGGGAGRVRLRAPAAGRAGPRGLRRLHRLHDRRRQRSAGAAAAGPGGRARASRRRRSAQRPAGGAPVRDHRRPEPLRRPHARVVRAAGLPPAPRGLGRSPAGHGRVLGQQQGRRVRHRELEAVRGAARAGLGLPRTPASACTCSTAAAARSGAAAAPPTARSSPSPGGRSPAGCASPSRAKSRSRATATRASRCATSSR